MRKLDEQIKALLRKKAKIDLLQRVVANLRKEKEELPDFPGLVKEVADLVCTFCEGEIKVLEEVEETPKVQKPAPKPQPVAVEEVDDEKLPAKPDTRKLISKTRRSASEHANSDPLMFMNEFRDWQDKKVTVHDDTGVEMEGTFVGLKFPLVKVEIKGKVIAIDPKYVALLD